MKKLSLEIESLAVDTFQTTRGATPSAGTVLGHSGEGGDDPMPTPPVEIDYCTCLESCRCPTAAYYCATAPATAVSCGYTVNVSCYYETTDC